MTVEELLTGKNNGISSEELSEWRIVWKLRQEEHEAYKRELEANAGR